jgi:UDP-N-acetylmuramoyl-L-alanyl-D-glutamate--2,6-diaminopimelate ligase
VDSRILSDLLKDIPASGDVGLGASVSGIAYRSDRVSSGDVFFCVPGLAFDGHDFAEDAVARGAAAVVGERHIEGLGAPQVTVHDSRTALARASSLFFGEPTRRLDVVGVTGTNGKTTTCYLIDSIASAAGRTTGLIGTVETRVGDTREPAGRTTPESRDLQELFARMADAGISTVAMEVSSHAIDLHRVDGVRFAVAAFTNLSQDHLDYHRTMEEYFTVKSRLFTEMPVGRHVICVDDEAGRRLAERASAPLTVGRVAEAAVRASDVVLRSDGTSFTLVTPVGSAAVELPLAGDFNVANALVAAGCGLALGFSLDEIADGLAAAPQVPGRLERVDEGQGFAVLVDYAHTPDGLAKAIASVRAVTRGRVITVFGCGGDRDPQKRPLMGEAAGALSDVVVVTSDNPRSEDPAGIILQIQDGMRSATAEIHVEVDRRRAIALALGLACSGDAVLIAGKGHEDYQIFADRTIHFDDREVAREGLRARAGATC